MDIGAVDPGTLDLAHTVSKLSFRFFTEAEALKHSVARISTQHSYDDLGRPIPRGLYDPALGPTSVRDGPCPTCGLFYQTCPGHFGHIELPFPVPNPLLDKVHLRLLRSSCASCYRLLHSKSDIVLHTARLYFEDAGLPRPAYAVEAFRVLRRPPPTGARQRNTNDTSVTPIAPNAPNHPIVKNWKGFLSAMPDPLPKYLRDVDSHDAGLIERNMLRAAEVTWKRAARAGKLAETRSKGWREAYASVLSGISGPCSSCARASANIRVGERGRLFRQFMQGGTEVLITPLEVERQVSGLWGHYPDLFELLFGMKGRRTSTEDRNNLHRRLFVKNILVPPSRFRPSSVVAHMETAAEHPQNMFFQRVLTEIEIIATANQFGLEGEPAAEEEEDDGESENPVVNRPTKARFAQAMANLQDALREMYDSSQSPVSPAGNQPTGIRQQLEAKAGLFRQHMMGKRVNYSCRSVIGPDVFLDTDEVGIPESFAKLLSVPEPATPRNLPEMQRAVINGPQKHPGALAVEDQAPSGETRVIKFSSRTSKQMRESQAALLLQNRASKRQGRRSRATWENRGLGGADTAETSGDMVPKRVHRHLQNGDIVLFNRQPTLHRVSIMAHRVKILPGDRTIRFHYANCSSYNADFDGDEMNIHVPQDYLSRAEAEELMLSSRHYIVPTSGAPVRGLIQDHIAAATLLSKRDTFLDRETFMQLLYAATERLLLRKGREDQRFFIPTPTILKPRLLWTGKQLISAVLLIVRNGKPGLNLHGTPKVKPAMVGNDEAHIIVRNGELLQGVIDKSSIGASMYGLTHAVQEAYGCEASDDFLSAIGRMCLYYMRLHGHTTGVGDLVLQAHGDKKRVKIIEKGIKASGIEIANSVSQQMSNTDESDEPVAKTAEDARLLIEEMVRRDGDQAEDRLDSGMKSALNGVASDVMTACVPAALRRPFPHNGFALMTNTGAKGSAVNSAQISCLLGSTVLEGKRVPRMGGSGATLPCFKPFDPSPLAGGFIASRFLTGITPQEFFFHAMSGREGLLDTSLKTANSGYLQRCLVKHMEGVRLHYDGSARDSDDRVLQFIYGDDGIDPSKSRWLTNKVNWQISNKKTLKLKSRPTDSDVLKVREEMGQDMPGRMETDPLLERVSPGAIAKRGAISEKFEEVIKEVEKNSDGADSDARDFLEGRYEAGAAQPGDCVGVLAAQGVGEPSTQMTLNTFHHAGSSSAHVTLGIPRLRELLMTAAKYPNTPSMTIPVITPDTKKGAEELQRLLQRVSLQDLMMSIEIRDISIFFARGVSDSAIRKVAIALYFPEEETYEDMLGLNFDVITSFVAKDFIVNLNDIVSLEAKRLSKQNGHPGCDAAVAYLRCCRDPEEAGIVRQVKRKPDIVAGQENEGENIDADIDDENHTQSKSEPVLQESGSSSGEGENEDESDAEDGQKQNAVKMEDELAMEQFDSDALAARTRKEARRKRKLEKEQKRKAQAQKESQRDPEKNVEAMDIDEEEPLRDRDFYGSFGFVVDSTKGIDRRIVELEWTFPLFFAGSIDIGSAVKKAAAKSMVTEVDRIMKCFVTEDDGTHTVITEGSNLPDVFDKGLELIDFDRLDTNDMFGILNTYGVEAMRTALIQEFVKVFDAYGIPVNIRHLQLIADYMTADGEYRGFNRVGMLNAPGTLQKMSFETSVKFLTEAAINGTPDHVHNPSCSIALGQVSETGTGGFQLIHQVN